MNPTDKLARRLCVDIVGTAATDARITVRTDRLTQITTCETWGTTCEASVGCN